MEQTLVFIIDRISEVKAIIDTIFTLKFWINNEFACRKIAVIQGGDRQKK